MGRCDQANPGCPAAQRVKYSWLFISPNVRQYAMSTPAHPATSGMMGSRTRAGVSLRDHVATNSAWLASAQPSARSRAAGSETHATPLSASGSRSASTSGRPSDPR